MIHEAQAPAAARQILSFVLGAEEYGIDLAHVREIVRYESPTRVPRMPPCVRGVVNLRGSVVPVVDLALGLGLAPAAATALTCLVVLELAVGGERAAVGLVVDAVSSVLELGDDALEPAPAFGTRVSAALLLGLARADSGIVPLLDVSRLFESGALHGTAQPADAPARGDKP